MNLTNNLIQEVIMTGLGLSMGQEITPLDLWKHLCETGYREKAIKFMEVQSSKLPFTPDLRNSKMNELLRGMDRGEDIEIVGVKFKIIQVQIEPIETSGEIHELGKYIVRLYGVSFKEESGKWCHNSTQMFSLMLE
jgi:hypothetical protein